MLSVSLGPRRRRFRRPPVSLGVGVVGVWVFFSFDFFLGFHCVLCCDLCVGACLSPIMGRRRPGPDDDEDDYSLDGGESRFPGISRRAVRVAKSRFCGGSEDDLRHN